MKRKLLIVTLALGTVGGFASGFMSLRCHGKWKRHQYQQTITDICADAMRQSQQDERPLHGPPAP